MTHKRKMKNWIIIILFPTLPLLGRQEFQEDKGHSQKKADSQKKVEMGGLSQPLPHKRRQCIEEARKG